ncbi:metalloregulator ArsR/SmtB family transcription factor [Embleya sp. NPDC050154]|uniref:metalloregulator ArsR/SmtB family transcription factor n=1 Tax=unclassified Embleya TaxID=2699296 RepID=UPI0037A9AFAA
MEEIIGAIADPVRREILVLLREARLSAGEISDRFAISRPAVSRHLRVLRESGLVRDELVGRHRYYVVQPDRFDELAAWLARFARPSVWESRLDALETEVHRTRRERRAAAGTPGRVAEPPASAAPTAHGKAETA